MGCGKVSKVGNDEKGKNVIRTEPVKSKKEIKKVV